MPICPNKNTQQWKDLVEFLKKRDPKLSDARIDAYAKYTFFEKGDGSIPTLEEASAILFKGKTKQVKADIKEKVSLFANMIGADTKEIQKLNDRLAKGEIKQAEYEQRVKELKYEGRFKEAEARIAAEIEGKKAGRREGRVEERATQREFAKRVSDYLQGLVGVGDLTSAQAAAISRRAAKVGTSEASYKKFTDYLDKVIDDVNYDTNLSTGRKLQSKLEKPFAESAELVKRMRDIPIEEMTVDELTKFNELAQQFVNSKKPVGSPEYKAFDAAAVEAEFKAIEDAVSSRKISSIEEAYGVFGLSAEEAKMLDEYMSSEDMDAFESNLEESKKKQLRTNLERIADYSLIGLKDKLAIDSDAYETKYGTKTLKKLQRISDLDVSKIQDNKQLVEVVRTIDNAIINNSNSNIGNVYSIVLANENLPRLMELTSNVKKGVMGALTKAYYDTPIILKRIFGDRKVSAAFRSLSGYDGVITGSGSAERQTLSKKKAYDKFRKENKIGNDVETDLGIGVFSRLNDVRVGVENADYINEKRQLELSIDRLRSSKNAEDNIIGDYLGLIYEVAVKENNTHEGFVKSFKEAYPKEAQAAEWVAKNMWKEKVSEFKRHAEEDLNETFDDSERLSYHPKRYYKVEEIVEVQGPDSENYYRRSMSPKETGRSKERTLEGDLPKDKVVDYRFEYNTFKSFQEEAFEIESYESAKTFEYMSKLNGFNEALGGLDNANFIKDTYNQQYNQLRYGKKNVDELTKSMTIAAVRTARNMGTAIALGRATQIFTQSTPSLNTMFQNPKYFFEVLKARIPSDLPLYNLSIIGARGQEMGAVGRAETSEAVTYTKARRGLKKALTEYSQWTGRMRDKSLYLLAATDVATAKKSFLSYYLKYMNEAGVPTTAKDLATEHLRMDDLRKEALSYAQQAVDETQGVSSRAMYSQLKRNVSGDFFGEFARNVVMPFNNFASNTRARIIEDGSKIIYGDARQRAESARDLAGTIVETGAFAAINAFFVAGIYRYGLKTVMQSVFGIPKDKNFEKYMSDKFRVFYTNMTKELLISGFGSGVENAGLAALNRLAYLLSSKSKEESGADYYDWLKKEATFKPGYVPQKGDAVTDVIGNIGGYGIAIRSGQAAYEDISSSISGEAEKQFSFEKMTGDERKQVILGGTVKEKVKLSDDERAFYLFMGMLNGTAILTGLTEADITRSAEQVKYGIEGGKQSTKKGKRSMSGGIKAGGLRSGGIKSGGF